MLLGSINYCLIKTCKRTRTSFNLFPGLYLSVFVFLVWFIFPSKQMAAEQFVNKYQPHNWAFWSSHFLFFASLILDWKLFQTDKTLYSWLSWISFWNVPGDRMDAFWGIECRMQILFFCFPPLEWWQSIPPHYHITSRLTFLKVSHFSYCGTKLWSSRQNTHRSISYMR